MDGRTNDYEKTFASYDKDGDGTISYNEFGAVMKGLGKNLLFKSFSDRNNLDRQDRSVPIYLNSMVVISVSIAVILVVIVCAIAYVYLNLEEKKAVLQRTGYLSASPSKNFQYISTASTPSHSQPVVSEEGSLTLRYTDSSDRGKPLMSHPPIHPASLWAQQQGPIMEEDSDNYVYDSLPYNKNQRDKKVSSFATSPPQPPRNTPGILISTNKKTNLTQSPFSPSSTNSQKGSYAQKNHNYPTASTSIHQPSTSSNVFCEADVHCANGDTRSVNFFAFQA